jgi:hypothetical protein
MGYFFYDICLILIFFFSLLWEIIENILLLGKKLGKRRDSLINSVVDIIFFFNGGFLARISFFLEFMFFLIYTLLSGYGLIFITILYYFKIIKKEVKIIS